MYPNSNSPDEILLDKTGDLTGGNFCRQVYVVSADGSVVAGFSNTALGIEAFQWTATGAVEDLGDLPDNSQFKLQAFSTFSTGCCG